MESKQKTIAKAYGKDWEKVKDFVNADGWCQTELVQDDDGNIIKCSEGHIFKESDTKYCINSIERCPKCNSIVAFHHCHYRFVEISEDVQKRFGEWRPKELQGIEDNNGWTKIDAHSVLPKNGTECWVKTKLSDAIFCAVYWNESFISGDVVFRLSEATYFQIIEKPKPPIY